MKRLFLLITIACLSVSGNLVFGQTYKTTTVQKKVAEFQPLSVDTSTPFNTYLSKIHMWITGKESMYNQISSYSHNMHLVTPADKVRSQEYIDRQLNMFVEEMIEYGDSVACVITYDPSEDYYILYYVSFESGQWVNKGENIRSTLESSRADVERLSPNYLAEIPLVERVRDIPTDTGPFVDYLRDNAQVPKDYILDKLSRHRIVVFGEKHRRKASWDLMKSVIADQHFTETTGTVFLELPSHMQPVMDEFMARPVMDGELVIDIMWEEQPHGWWDRGEYEFICDLWTVNRALPDDKKIKVVLVDFQIPYSQLKSEEEQENCFEMDRNLHMADRIEGALKGSSDKRNALFVVGYGHAYKCHVPGGASTPRGQEPQLTAGAQLVQRFSDEDVFCIVQHWIAAGNMMEDAMLIRMGLFDKAFDRAGVHSVAFDLKDSPFGREPFSHYPYMAFDPRTGNYEDNFDGYVLLEPLRTEGNEYILYDSFTPKYVDELKRRATDVFRYGKNYWFGLEPHELTPERISEAFRSATADPYPYEEIFRRFE